MANEVFSCPITGKQCPATVDNAGQIGGPIPCMWSYPDAKKRHNKCKLLATLDSISWNLKIIADEKVGNNGYSKKYHDHYDSERY
jgi:hypothetical protein